MKETSLEKKANVQIREKSQYAVAFGAIAIMLWFVGFPVFILFFFTVLGFFIWKAFASETRNETRRIFEFYLSANEILRDDDRRWYGFEIQETIARGESILRSMPAAPPLLHFSLGSLYNKIGDQSSAVKHFTYLVEDTSADEAAIVYPTKELREYVRILRKIERSPAEAPLTSSAIRSLERARKNKGADLLAQCRAKSLSEESILSGGATTSTAIPETSGSQEIPKHFTEDVPEDSRNSESERGITYRFADFARSKKTKKAHPEETNAERKTISEVLHDIYDKNG